MPSIESTGKVSNPTSYSLAVQSSALTAGVWQRPPQPVSAEANVEAFQATGASGTATGVVGEVVYAVTASGAGVGTCTLTFSDPYLGLNSAGFSTTVAGLTATCAYPTHGSSITFQWTLSTS